MASDVTRRSAEPQAEQPWWRGWWCRISRPYGTRQMPASFVLTAHVLCLPGTVMPTLLLLKFFPDTVCNPNICACRCRMLQISDSSFPPWEETLSSRRSSERSSSSPVCFESAHLACSSGPTTMYVDYRIRNGKVQTSAALAGLTFTDRALQGPLET